MGLSMDSIIPIVLIIGPLIYYFFTKKEQVIKEQVSEATNIVEEKKETSGSGGGISPGSLFGNQKPKNDLPEPKDDIFTPEELKKYDGSDESLPVYLAIKGKVFDVSDAREAYGPGGNYNCFAGIDGSRGLATSSLKKADMSHDYSDLGPDKLKVLDHWYNFYLGKYPIVGVVKRD